MPFEIGRTQLIIGAVILALLVIFVAPVLFWGGASGAREEVPVNVEAIRMAEIQYHSAFESYISAEAAPRDPLSVDGTPVPWKPTAGFRTLSWAPEGESVLGSYWVNANANGFTVNGTCDTDNDGVQARYTATAEDATKQTTDNSVY